jgi:hypothetical protein
MNSSNNKDAIPFQVQHLIDSMLNTRDNVYVRGNFRNRLAMIRDEIDKAIKTYDNNVYTADMQHRRKKEKSS